MSVLPARSVREAFHWRFTARHARGKLRPDLVVRILAVLGLAMFFGAGCQAFAAFDQPTETGGQCSDGVDNDGNGLTDCADPSCASAPICMTQPSSNKALTSFTFPAAINSSAGVTNDVIATIIGTNVTATVPFGTDATALIADFDTTGASVTVGGLGQVSNVTANDFSNSVVYTIAAADGSTQNYTVTIIVSASSAKVLTTFVFPEALNKVAGISSDVSATITGTNVTATVPFGTDVTALIATFTNTGTSVTVNGTIQVSNVTANDFTNPVVYQLGAADGTTQIYIVTVTVAASSAKELTAFAFPVALNGSAGISTDVIATINGIDVTATVPFGTDVTALVADFATTGATIVITGTTQVNDVTVNDFTNPVVYTVVAADGSKQDYTVTISVTPSSTNTLESFAFAAAANGGAGIGEDVFANVTGNDVAIAVPFGTDVTALVATFTTTGAKVIVNGTEQVDGVSANDFTNSVIYTVVAADGSKQDYTVTVTADPGSNQLVTGGLEAHYDAQDLSSISQDVDHNLLQWFDISGNNHNLVANGTSPSFSLSLINHHPGVDLSNQAGLITSDQPALSNTVTVIFVVTWYPVGQPNDWGSLGFQGDRNSGWSLEQNQAAETGFPNTIHWQTDNDDNGGAGGCNITLNQGESYILVGTLSNAGGGASRTFDAISFADPNQPQIGSCDSVPSSYSPTFAPIFIGRSDENESSNAYIGEVLYYDRVLTAPQLTQDIEYLGTRWSSVPQIPTDGLLLRWKLDEGTGTVATDSSGNGFDGTLVNSNWETSGCVLGACAQFTGIGGPGGSNLQLNRDVPTGGGGVSFAAWVQFDPNVTGGYQTIFDGPYTACCTFRLFMDGARHPFWNAGEHADLSFSEYTFPLGQWVHVVWTIGGGTGTIYIDGVVVLQSSAGVSGSFPDIPNLDIAGGDSFAYPARAIFNDVLIYNRVLSSSEVADLYSSY